MSPQFSELKLALRNMGTGLIVEGPSKVGKSTAIKKAMETLRVADGDQVWWHGQAPPPLDEFQRTLDELRRTTRNTWLFIDDFHYLEDEQYRRALAICMKLLADQATRHAKITLIGINPLGNSLLQIMPDLSGRVRLQRINVEKYDAARVFLEQLMSGFGLAARQIALVPGNHDVSWSLAEAGYSLRKRSQQRSVPPPGTFIQHGADVIEVRDEEAYRRRFQPFADCRARARIPSLGM